MHLFSFSYISKQKSKCNTMNERTSGALSLTPSGNLEGSLYYYLLINNQVDNKNKARPIPITDDIISFMNNKSIGRKI